MIFRHSTYVLQNVAQSLKHVSVQIKRAAVSLGRLRSHQLSQVSVYLKKNVSGILDKKKWYMQRTKEDLLRGVVAEVNTESVQVQNIYTRLMQAIGSDLIKKKSALEGIEKTVNNLDPEMVLKRGYSITMFNGKVVSSIHQLNTGDILETKMLDGKVVSVVNDVKKN